MISRIIIFFWKKYIKNFGYRIKMVLSLHPQSGDEGLNIRVRLLVFEVWIPVFWVVLSSSGCCKKEGLNKSIRFSFRKIWIELKSPYLCTRFQFGVRQRKPTLCCGGILSELKRKFWQKSLREGAEIFGWNVETVLSLHPLSSHKWGWQNKKSKRVL